MVGMATHSNAHTDIDFIMFLSFILVIFRSAAFANNQKEFANSRLGVPDKRLICNSDITKVVIFFVKRVIFNRNYFIINTIGAFIMSICCR